jgi:hypothetical protein
LLLILSSKPSLATSSTPADWESVQSNLIQHFASEIPAKFGLVQKSNRLSYRRAFFFAPPISTSIRELNNENILDNSSKKDIKKHDKHH